MDKIKDLGLELGEVLVDNRELSEIVKDLPILKVISVTDDIRNIKIEKFPECVRERSKKENRKNDL